MLLKKRRNQLLKQPIMVNGHICTSLSVLLCIFDSKNNIPASKMEEQREKRSLSASINLGMLRAWHRIMTS
ncbi:Predicted protein [Anoxybacillus flavithermus WK1]|uniref:Uncharacterized protein n=1 Tax=Anoxybacillus flavithermus (strain DSM 21510 / WK1) TaxID=491915 RepID=B7GJY3_ANOFW|nr:Predicted protein [Anoxybacillus flavithermus WK1]